MTRIRGFASSTFRSLRTRNYRIYFVAQIISVSGTWMQSVAQAWLVLRLSPPGRAGVDLGLVTALQFLPMLLFGTYGGLIADRVDKRRLLYATQSTALVLALVLGILTATHEVELWQVYLLALGLGFVNMFDNPARQTFVIEMVGRGDLPNAVSLNSVLMNGARVVGPAIGGVLIATVGLATCFFVNAASYVAVIVGLSLMHGDELHRTTPVARAKGQLREGFRYIWRTPGIRDPLILVAVVGTLAYNFMVVLALFAKYTFGGGPGAYSALLSLMGLGAVIGGLLVATRNRPNVHRLTAVGLVFGTLIVVLALAPTLPVAMVVVVPMGAASIAFIATANATLQLRSEPTMRGRVMALYAVAFLGTTPIGAPLVGWISQETSPRVALLVGGTSTLVAAALTRLRHRREHERNAALAAAEAATAARAAGAAGTVADRAEPGSELGVA
ncbi:MAG TPA: MFS transporter [Acidimicrobiales bacterium]|nr:MFS transporter [Acidimicrobiales bacterium]